MIVMFKPKFIPTMFGCDVHLKDKLIENSTYDNLDHEVLNIRLMNEELNLSATEAAQLIDYITEWLYSCPKNTAKENDLGDKK